MSGHNVCVMKVKDFSRVIILLVSHGFPRCYSVNLSLSLSFSLLFPLHVDKWQSKAEIVHKDHKTEEREKAHGEKSERARRIDSPFSNMDPFATITFDGMKVENAGVFGGGAGGKAK